ncbi:MAG TPA: FAD-binding oxidoreductase [Thermodesulfobacteriota bacterium]|nr:FAD-binding oxidoreductase [Thermodesulfobacteriota bacterium]
MHPKAMELFEEAIGRKNVLTAHSTLREYHAACIPVSRNIDAVLRPDSAEEVQRIVGIAAEYGVPLYPISSGNNWGYGSSNPVRDHNTIVDLRRMNRIREVNEELAYAVIEPGVTQGQLAEYLHQEKIPLMIDPTGASPNCSILGNSLERGYGITPYGDHFSSVCGMEIVLSDGKILKTGFGHYSGAKATHTFKYGVGPYLDGIFTQSSYGIVTKIGVWLMPEPECFETFVFQTNKEDGIGPLVEAVRPLLLNEVVKSSINLMHRNRVLSVMTQYPWDEAEEKTPLSKAVSENVARDRNIGAWNGLGALYGSKRHLSASRKTIKKALRGKVDRLEFITSTKIDLLTHFGGLIGLLLKLNVPETIKALEPSFGILRGIPSELTLHQPYWRMKKSPPKSNINPAHDNCGAFWFSPVIPMAQRFVEEFIGLANPILARNGFESCITLTSVTRRAFDCTLPIYYNKENSDETKRAAACYEELFETCMKEGYIPYRFGIHSMEKETTRDDVFWDITRKIKEALDPCGILSPGRYSR